MHNAEAGQGRHMGCGIHAHSDHSPNNRSTTADLCNQPHDAHERGATSTMEPSGDGTTSHVSTSYQPSLVSASCPTHIPPESRAFVAADGV